MILCYFYEKNRDKYKKELSKITEKINSLKEKANRNNEKIKIFLLDKYCKEV